MSPPRAGRRWWRRGAGPRPRRPHLPCGTYGIRSTPITGAGQTGRTPRTRPGVFLPAPEQESAPADRTRGGSTPFPAHGAETFSAATGSSAARGGRGSYLAQPTAGGRRGAAEPGTDLTPAATSSAAGRPNCCRQAEHRLRDSMLTRVGRNCSRGCGVVWRARRAGFVWRAGRRAGVDEQRGWPCIGCARYAVLLRSGADTRAPDPFRDRRNSGICLKFRR
jgi:hypothetical protein